MKDREGTWTILPLDQLDYKKNNVSRHFEDSCRTKSRSKFIDKCLHLLEDDSQGREMFTLLIYTSATKNPICIHVPNKDVCIICIHLCVNILGM